MNSVENLKHQKLRNNEYYSFQEIQDNLYARSKKGEKFNSLMSIITSDENILLAYRNIKNNTGSRTKGTDERTIEHLAKLEPTELITLIKRKLSYYTPQKVRRIEIPKSDGKKRPLGIPTITDRLIQQCILQVLEPICEAKFHNHSYGFRPLRSTKHAISRAMFLSQRADLHYVIDIDIKGFFDNINHGKLLKQIWNIGIRDKKLISIISQILKADIEGIGKQEKGTPQGGIISPLLANITLNELDWWIDKQWNSIPTKYTHSSQGNKIVELKRKSKLKEMYIIRYADDFKIFCRDLQSAKKTYYAVKQWLWERLKLEINDEKSGIINLKTQYSEFLGIKLKVHPKGKTKKGETKYVTKSHVSNKSAKTICEKIRKHAKSMQRPKDNNPYKAINAYNAYILGVHNYFNSATNCSIDFNKIAFQCRATLKNRLHPRKRKEKDTIPKHISEKYGKSEQIRFIYNIAIIPIGYIQHQKLMNFSQLTIFNTEDREKIHSTQQAVDYRLLQWLMSNPVKGQSAEYNDNRISLFVGQYGKCYVTGKILHVDEIRCHHIEPKAKGGTDKYNNLVIVCDKVHILIHATESATIEKYLNELMLEKEEMKRLNKLRKAVGNQPL